MTIENCLIKYGIIWQGKIMQLADAEQNEYL